MTWPGGIEAGKPVLGQESGKAGPGQYSRSGQGQESTGEPVLRV